MRSRKIDKRENFWFMVWFVFCALVGLGMSGVMIWAVITLVNHFTR